MNERISSLILSIGIAIGLLGAGYMVSQSRIADRYVEVKGLAEKTVKSDYASWTINYRATGNSLEDALSQTETYQAKIMSFLKNKGFEDKEFEKGQIKITDREANPYGDNRVYTNSRFIVDGSITLRTNKVDNIVSASQQTLDLAKTGVVLATEYYSAPNFEFKGLDKLKPEMIALATKDARRAADQFAKDSGAEVGDIRKATQGYFSIEPLDQIPGGANNSSLYQKVRVVSTIEFFFD